MSTVANARTWNHPLESGNPPDWADEWGQDQEYGPWCTIRVETQSQKLRWVPPGSFDYGGRSKNGANALASRVQCHMLIDQGFWIFDTPCTQRFYLAVIGKSPSYFKAFVDDRPMESVTWFEARVFTLLLSQRIAGLRLALPSEAQWEYSCRAGSTSDWYADNIDAIAWHSGNSGRSTKPVGTKQPNAWGLHDMLGNVWEWCEDVWTPNPGIKPVQNASSRSNRVLRGGSWRDSARRVCAGERFHHNPSGRYSYIGFRCAEYREGEVRPVEPPRQA